MAKFDYTPDEEIQMHRENAIRHMCTPFASHENGLPEWVKNSAAAYTREGRPAGDRIILLGFCNERGNSPASISCLDFVGMTSTHIERDFRRWADPDAASRGSHGCVRVGELGGHGSGGKCYMTQMFEEYSLVYTVRDGKGCKYGVAGGCVSFGYIPSPGEGKDFPVEDVFGAIDSCLRGVWAHSLALPDDVARIARKATGFTFVQGVRPRFCDGKVPAASLIESLLAHHQMITPLQTCEIYVLVNGKPYAGGRPLSLPYIKPMPGFEGPRVVRIPVALRDEASGQQISMTQPGALPAGELRILTSEKNMRRGGRGTRQCRHTVTYHTSQSGVIGKIPMLNLDVPSNYRDYLYCECYLDALDPYQRNERAELAESPLTRAVESWISGQVRAYCREMEARDRRLMHQKDKDQLSQINEWLDEWKNQFVQEFMRGLYGEGLGTPIRRGSALPSGVPARIELSLSHALAGVGVYFRPTIDFFDRDKRRIRAIPYRWVSEDANVAMVDEDLMLVQTFAPGVTKIHAEALDGGLRSNSVSLEVIRILDIRVVPHELEIPAGTRRRFEAVCRTPAGGETSNIYLTWVEDNPSVARVSASGLVYAFAPGQTEVTAMDESCRCDIPATVIVTPDQGRASGKSRGRGFPKILVSEIDVGPGESTPAVLKPDEPPVYQRTQDVDNNVWWINVASPFARLYSSTDRGYGVASEAWRMYHVERVIDIIVQIALSQGPDSEGSLGPTDWINRAAEIEADIRVKAIESLTDFIESGQMSA